MLDAIAKGAGDRIIMELATELCAASSGIDSPALSPAIEGEWRLLHTSSSSFDPRNPLGRRVDGATPGLEGAIAAVTGGRDVQQASSSPIQRAFTSAFLVAQTINLSGPAPARVNQVVTTPAGVLRLNALARVSADEPVRIRFAFDEGYFESRGGLRVPYPVPFRLLGKEAEGYLDTLYLSDTLRVSKGNKGTTFILEKDRR